MNRFMKRLRDTQPATGLMLAYIFSLLPCVAWAATPNYAMITEKALTSMLLDIAAAGDNLVAVGERGHILYSEDGGKTWVQARVPVSTMLTRIFFISPELGWAVGHDGNVLVSRDGGINWELQRDGVSAQAQINEERAGRAKVQLEQLYEQAKAAPEDDQEDLDAALEEAAHKLKVARDALNEQVFAPPLMDVWFTDEERGWASGAYGTLLHTSNSGRHWDDWSHKVDNPEELHLNGVAGAPDGSLYLASEWGTVFRSQSNGAHWEPLETGYDGSFLECWSALQAAASSPMACSVPCTAPETAARTGSRSIPGSSQPLRWHCHDRWHPGVCRPGWYGHDEQGRRGHLYPIATGHPGRHIRYSRHAGWRLHGNRRRRQPFTGLRPGCDFRILTG